MTATAAERRARRRRRVELAWFAVAVVGAMVGLETLWLHLTSDPLADARAYYDAGARLNAGEPLYPAGQDINENTAYFYPPLFAMLFRPLALLPFPAAAAIWEVIVVGCFVATLWLLGIRRREVWYAVGALGLPIAWSLAVAQAHSLVTLLLTIGNPFAIAFAANIKLFPVLAGIWFVGRRDWRRVGELAGWITALVTLQFVLEPQATLDYIRSLGLGWVGEIRNISPYAISPILWAVLLAAGALLALRLAPTRFGWAAAITLSTLAPPRLLSYMLMGLLAALRKDRFAGQPADPPDAAANPPPRHDPATGDKSRDDGAPGGAAAAG
jgi:hypothetical protein